MRIDATNRSSKLSGRSATGKAGNGPAFVPAGEQSAPRVSTTAPVAPTAGLDAILALQASGDFSESRRKAVRKGTELLDLLEDMKADLLIGRVAPERLDTMVTQLRTLRERVEPELDRVLDDIELRVLVELAKLGRYPQI
ncbi:flagellar assembly protein FliX [Devosia sp. Naph2]|uniref:flagellar assembly protein FliX n=1 Tax=Devosia polycyclovorans TaxID=3345148 RepID=UPI0035D0196E